MRQYALRRLAYLPLIMLVVSLVTFFTLRLPWATDPVLQYVNQNTTLEQEQEIRRELGLDKPMLQQFAIWMGEVARGAWARPSAATAVWEDSSPAAGEHRTPRASGPSDGVRGAFGSSRR